MSFMDKLAKRSGKTGRFIVGRATTEKISAVEGLRRSDRTGRLLSASDSLGETPAQLRARIRAEFSPKK
jgi:hypothetical protein